MKYKLGCIGAGNMGSAILQGAIRSGAVTAGDIAVFDPLIEKQQQCAQLGYQVLESEKEVYQNCDMVLFAIKPQGIGGLLETLKDCPAQPQQTIISIVTGVSTDKIRGALGDVHVVRVMPNTPLLLGCGASALCKGPGVSEDTFAKVLKIFASMGQAKAISEDKMNEIVPINGSSPAFVYYFIEILARWGEKQGIAYEDCLALAAKTFEGAAKMVLKGDDTPAELIRKVCSPGGTTLEAMAVLQKDGAAEQLLQQAADACARRAYELGK